MAGAREGALVQHEVALLTIAAEAGGAWVQPCCPAESIVMDVGIAMSRSDGSLTGPPLAVAATIVCDRAVPAMVHSIDVILAPVRRDGSEAIVAASLGCQ